MLSRKDRGRDFETLEAAALSERTATSAGMVDIKATPGRDKFHVLIDGTVFGPFSRVRMGPTRCANPPPRAVIMAFQPTDV